MDDYHHYVHWMYAIDRHIHWRCHVYSKSAKQSLSKNSKEIQNYLDNKDIKLLSDDIKIVQPIRSLGEHNIEINPYEGLLEEIKVFVKKK